MTTRFDSMDAELSRVYGELTAAQLERDRLALEVAVLRAENGLLWQAIPSPDGLESACACMAGNNPARRDLELRAARIRALSATPPAQAAEAVTAGGVWLTEADLDRRRVDAMNNDGGASGWEAALDQDQEADHAN